MRNGSPGLYPEKFPRSGFSMMTAIGSSAWYGTELRIGICTG
jgi:hypothetical protein